MNFSIKDFFSKCDQILNGKLHFLSSVICLKSIIKILEKDMKFNQS